MQMMKFSIVRSLSTTDYLEKVYVQKYYVEKVGVGKENMNICKLY